MKTFTIDRDDDRSLVFDGELLAQAHYSYPAIHGDTTLTLYQTRGGSFVCQRNRILAVSGDLRREAVVCGTEDEITAFFGGGYLARALYREAGIDYTIRIE